MLSPIPSSESPVAKSPNQAISEAVSALSAQLEAGNSEALTAHLLTVARFHSYSFGNQMAIACQRPTASRVAGFHTWKSLGRSVNKGEKAIRILAPMVAGRKDADTPAKDSKPRVFGFRSVCVFDIAQTSGADLPAFSVVSGDAADVLARLTEFSASQGIGVSFSDSLGSAYGVSYGGRIELARGHSDASTFSTLAHELAHELLHKAERRTSGNAGRRELEAEAVAYVICSAVGLELATQSADYIKLYGGDAEALTESLEAISRASTLILKAVLGKPGTAESSNGGAE